MKRPTPLLPPGDEGDPAVSFTDFAGMTHRVWPVTDQTVLEEVRRLTLDKPIFIADGHHRYETALNYRNALRERYGSGNPNASYEFIMVYLTDMNEPGAHHFAHSPALEKSWRLGL